MPEQLPLAVAHRTSPTLEGFIVGDNAEALHALRHHSGLLYLSGPGSSGKSHLLRGRARELAGARYLEGADIAAHSIALLEGADTVPWLGIDDVTALASAREAAIAFARVLDRRAAERLPTVVSAPLEVAALPDVLRDLQTRLSQGMAFRLRPPDEAALAYWLRQRANERGLELAASASDWLLRYLPRDPGHLEQALQRLDVAALAAKRHRITAPFARSVLGAR
ncbi:MAG: HdaA/DnaA family protein [Algiphilus sp.]